MKNSFENLDTLFENLDLQSEEEIQGAGGWINWDKFGKYFNQISLDLGY